MGEVIRYRLPIAASMLLLAACGASTDHDAATSATVIDAFCLDCHNNRDLAGNLALDGLDTAAVHQDRETWEKVVRKLRGGMMPPEGPRPDAASYTALTEYLEQQLDDAYEPMLAPPGMHRLNRVEYANAIRDLFGLAVDASEFLPSDDSSNGFDNQAGSLGLSPALLEAYLSAAGKISRRAVGTVATPTQVNYRAAEDTSQDYHVAGLPFGTRGGLVIEHNFPVTAEYELRILPITLGNMGNTRPFGGVDGETLIILIDGEEIERIDWDDAFSGRFRGGVPTLTLTIPVESGPRKLGVSFLAANYAPTLDFNKAFERSTIETGGLPGFTFFPHIGSVRIDGPFNPVGPNESPSRKKIFVCEPATAADEDPCARTILSGLSRLAYRGTSTADDVQTLMDFYAIGRTGGNFESGIEMALQRMLTEPKFLYRFEFERPDAEPGEAYPLSDIELASRLAFFLWSSIPDDELLTVAQSGELSEPDVYESQVRRMLADPKVEALISNFAGQWLALRNLDSHSPVVDRYPDFDNNLRDAFRRETELFFASILEEDRSLLDLLDADYTFVNDRLAKHYGIPGVQGSRFRRVSLDGDLAVRRGLIGKGSVLTVASYPERTSPVVRGNWILSKLIGIPAPDPPPDVPELEAQSDDAAGNTHEPTIREQMEMHRENPACQGCHNLMDPFGFALENFDATGRWRETDNGRPINTTATMYDGTPVNGPGEIREFLLRYDDQFVRNVVENLLTYALGRGVSYRDMPVVRQIVTEVAEDDYRLSSVLLAVARSEPFRMTMRPSNVN